jgi:hypothetical protein
MHLAVPVPEDHQDIRVADGGPDAAILLHLAKGGMQDVGAGAFAIDGSQLTAGGQQHLLDDQEIVFAVRVGETIGSVLADKAN